jgi:hypothetical protein
MVDTFLEQLGELEVPPPPAEFDAQLHERVNESLLGVQLAELVVQVMPLAFVEMLRAFAGLVVFTITGRYEAERPGKQGDKSSGPES